MQREIKFRAWLQYSKQMIINAFMMRNDGVADFGTGGYGILMQYTGLKDKNGKECYWDDWVTDGINPKFLVTPDYHLLARLSEIEFEIVGNKYED